MDFESVSLEDLMQLGPNPNFGAWAVQSTQTARKDIDLLIKVLIQAGVASDKMSALEYLDNLSKDFQYSDLVGADFEAITYSRKMKRLKEVYEHSEQKGILLYRMMGVLTHKFTWMLDSGKMPYHLTQSYLKEQKDWMQRSLLDLMEPSDRLFPEPAPFGASLGMLKDSRFLADLVQLTNAVQPVLQENKDWKKRCRKMRTYVHELQKMLQPVLGTFMDDLVRYRGVGIPEAEYLTGLTLIIWAMIVNRSAQNESLLILPELPVMHRNHRIGFRRIDGLVIDTIDGRKPNKQQREVLQKCIDAVSEERYKPESVSDFLIMLSKIMNAKIGASILDYKSAVGDFTNETDYLISPEKCPMPSHENQISMYLLLTGLDRYLVNGGDGDGDPWANEHNLTKGSLLYLLPTCEPISVPVDRTPAEQQMDFIKNVVMKIPRAKQTGLIRRLSGFFANHTLYLMEGNTFQANKVASKNLVSKQPRLFPMVENTRPLEKLCSSMSIISWLVYS